jgi:hypothetical protein
MINENEWDTALIKSIFYVGFAIAIGALFIWFIPVLLNDIYGLAVTFLLYMSVYLFISILGWLFIGFPIHWLIQKYTNGSYIFYIALPAIFIVISLYGRAPILFSLAAFFQALLFRYYLHQKPFSP